MKLYVGDSTESITLLKYMLKHRIKCQVFRVKKNVIILELDDRKITGLNDVFNYLKDFSGVKQDEPQLRQSSNSFEEASLKWMQEKEQDDVIHDEMNLDSKMEETMAARKGRTPAPQGVKNNEPVINKQPVEETTFRKKPVSEIKDADDAMAQSLVNKILEQFDDD